MTPEQYHLGYCHSQKNVEGADGTNTQVAICMINKWRAEINENEVYNVRNPLGMGDRKKRDQGKTVDVFTTL